MFYFHLISKENSYSALLEYMLFSGLKFFSFSFSSWTDSPGCGIDHIYPCRVLLRYIGGLVYFHYSTKLFFFDTKLLKSYF